MAENQGDQKGYVFMGRARTDLRGDRRWITPWGRYTSYPWHSEEEWDEEGHEGSSLDGVRLAWHSNLGFWTNPFRRVQ